MQEIKALPTRVISAEQDSLSIYLKKIVQHRALILTLAKRDLKVKYAQTYLGLACIKMKCLLWKITIFLQE